MAILKKFFFLKLKNTGLQLGMGQNMKGTDSWRHLTYFNRKQKRFEMKA